MAPIIPIEFAGHRESKNRPFSHTMGKARKYSKGHSAGFVPDYRHAVETMGESEWFGNCGQLNTEMTASGDSRALKRKCISLNADSCDSFGIPKEVLPVSKMSRSERRDTIIRLKMDLERVQILGKKISSLSSEIVMLSPSSDIRSYNDVQRRPSLEGFDRSVGISGSQGKKGATGRNGSMKKKSTSARPKSVKAVATTSTSNASVMKQCETLLSRLMSHPHAWIFNDPVDVVKWNIPDYYTVIKHPMDFGTVKRKLASNEYSSLLEFAADVRLTFSNAMTYNPPGHDAHIMAQTLSKLFESRWKAIEKKLPALGTASVLSLGDAHNGSETTAAALPEKKAFTAIDNKLKQEPLRQVMTVEEKRKLSADLEALLDELPQKVIDFLKEQTFSQGQIGEDEIEIDIDTFSDENLFKLRKLLDDHLFEKQQSQAKAEPCEMEIVNDSGFSNSPLRPGKGDEPVDEEVDIVGGYEAPISSHLMSETVKDAAHSGRKGSSSSSSTSDSGSSSSDSDSGSSSSRESDVKNRDKMESEAKVEQRTSDGKPQDISHPSLNRSHDVEPNSQDKQSHFEANGCQEVESAPCERPVSPEKLYRAALLKNRFADTILKAREKALDKGEKGDPEKLRIEREQLEKQRREEKARLQAEAKAAEEARRKAEAQAAAEAKRKREQEREAARQALQQMEKTVDINESSQVLEDIERLRAASQGDELKTFAEASPDLSENILGSFKIQGSSNPLEQLGLYMKMDDEDEDEEEEEDPKNALKPEHEEEVERLQSTPKQGNDMEDGEID